MSFSALPVNPLSNPKGTKSLCELCQQTATLQCSQCRVTFYCGEQHYQLDLDGIHSKICPLLAPLRALSLSQPVGRTAQNKAAQEKTDKLREIVGLTLEEGRALLFGGKHNLAVPAALQCIKFSKELYGTRGLELVQPFLVLAEASIGLLRLGHAEEYLSQAKFSLIQPEKAKHTSQSELDSMKSKLHRIYGLLYFAQNQTQKARNAFANDIYLSSIANGTTHRLVAGGYFYLGNTFLKEGKSTVALAFHQLVIKIWTDFFIENIMICLQDVNSKDGISEKIEFGPSLQAESSETLKSLLQHHTLRAYHLGDDSLKQLLASLSMLYFLLRDRDSAKKFAVDALQCDTMGLQDIDDILHALTK